MEDAWRHFVHNSAVEDLDQIIQDENPRPEETKVFVANAFRDGALKFTGADFAWNLRYTTQC